jgi:hypothetical protein
MAVRSAVFISRRPQYPGGVRRFWLIDESTGDLGLKPGRCHRSTWPRRRKPRRFDGGRGPIGPGSCRSNRVLTDDAAQGSRRSHSADIRLVDAAFLGIFRHVTYPTSGRGPEMMTDDAKFALGF